MYVLFNVSFYRLFSFNIGYFFGNGFDFFFIEIKIVIAHQSFHPIIKKVFQ